MSNIKLVLERVERLKALEAELNIGLYGERLRRPLANIEDAMALAACVRDLAEKVQKVAREPGYLARLDMAAAVLAQYGLEGSEE